MKFIMIAVMAVASASAMAAPHYPTQINHNVTLSDKTSHTEDAKSAECVRSGVKTTPPRCH